MSGRDSWRANICFDCLRNLLSLSRYAGLVLFRVQRTAQSRLARGGERRGDEKVQGARTGRTNRAGGDRFAAKIMESRARRKEGDLKFETASIGILTSRICHSRANKRLRG